MKLKGKIIYDGLRNYARTAFHELRDEDETINSIRLITTKYLKEISKVAEDSDIEKIIFSLDVQ